MENTLSIREELTGKTEMNPETENDLFERLEFIEREGMIVEPLPKSDWFGIVATFLILGIAPLLVYAFKLL